MAAPLQPIIWGGVILEKVPAGSGSDTYEWARRPVAAEGAFKEGRASRFGRIKRESASPFSGDAKSTRWMMELEDKDGVLRDLMAAKATRFWPAREAYAKLLSQAGMKAGVAPRYLLRGFVADVQQKPPFKFNVEVRDALSFYFTGINLDKKIPQRKMRLTEHSRLPEENRERPYPIIWGEHSDFGVIDAAGQPADVGRLPVFDTGDYVLTETGEFPEGAEPQYLDTPTNLAYVLDGASGTTEEQYVVTAISSYGETPASGILTISDAPAVLNTTDSITLTWDIVTDAIEYRVYKLTLGVFRLMARLNNNETFVNPEETWTDDGSAIPKTPEPPIVNTAQIDQDIDGESAFAWGRLVVSLAAMHSFHDVYASNLAEGEAQKRVRMGEEVYGTEFLMYGRPGWPHPTRTITINGIEMSVIYARGPRLEAHRSGTVTITINGCGAYGPNGLVYDEAFPTLQWIINEHILKNDGQGYSAGAYGPLVEYADGTPIVKPTAYAACQARTVEYIGGRGYITAGWIGDEITVREFAHRYMQTFDFMIADDHFGQIYPYFIENTNVDFLTGRLYRSRIEIRRCLDVHLHWDAVETLRRWDYDFNPAAGNFSIPDQKYENELWSSYYKESKYKDKIKCFYSRHKETVWDSQPRHVERFKDPPRIIAIETDYTGLEDENGDQVLVEHPEIDFGGNHRPMVVLHHEVNPDKDESVVLYCFDLSRYLILQAATGGAPFVTVSVPDASVTVGTAPVAAIAAIVTVTAPTANIALSMSPSAAETTVTANAATLVPGEAEIAATAATVTMSAPLVEEPQSIAATAAEVVVSAPTAELVTITLTSSGLLDADDFTRADAGTPGGNWVTDTGTASIVSNRLVLTGADRPAVRNTASSARAENFTQATVRYSNASFLWSIAHWDTSRTGYSVRIAGASGVVLDEWASAVFIGQIAADSTVAQSINTDYQSQYYSRDSVEEGFTTGNAGGDGTATATDSTNDAVDKVAWLFRTSVTSSANSATFDDFLWMKTKYITVTGLPSGFKAKVVNGSDSVVATATESGGTAQIDCSRIGGATEFVPFAGWPKLRITTSGDVTVQEYTLTAVYPGDVYDF